MANYITSRSFITASSYLASGTAAGFPASNAGDYAHPSRPWKSASNVSSGTEWIGADMGSAVLPVAVMIDSINVGTVRLQGATDSGFTSGTLTSSNIVLTQDVVDGRYKYFAELSDIPGATWASRQYWRVLDQVTTTLDTTKTLKMSVGSLSFFSAVDTWANNMAIEEAIIEPVARNEFEGGGDETIALNDVYAQITLSARVLPRTGMRATLHTVMGYGEAAPFLFYANDGDRAQAYIVKRRGVVGIRRAGPTSIVPASIVLNEVP